MFVVLKPVLWSPNGHSKPAGGRRLGKQWADQNGFAIEEWNGSPILAYPLILDGEKLRAFHAEPVKKAAAYPGATVILMYTTYGGGQYLVGAASRATNAVGDNQPPKLRAAMKPRMHRMEREAWNTSRVSERFNGNFEKFHKRFGPSGDDHLLPGWFAPVDRFFWLDAPAEIDVYAMTKKNKLLTEYRGSTHPTSDVAARILLHVPKAQRTNEWTNVFNDLYDESSTAEADVLAINANKKITATTRKALINARLGQGAFRTSVLRRWDDACAVTGTGVNEAIRASHICAWSKCESNEQRLDPNNGIPLVATIDALFDKHLITFDEDGSLIISKSIDASECRRLSLKGSLTKPLTTKAAAYMRVHRSAFRKREAKT